MKKLLFIFLIIFSSHSFAKLDGAGVICVELNRDKDSLQDTVGIFFLDDKRVEVTFIKDDDVETTINLFYASAKQISIFRFKNDLDYQFVVNRNSLFAAHMSESNENLKIPYQCYKTQEIYVFDENDVDEMRRHTISGVKSKLNKFKSKRRL